MDNKEFDDLFKGKLEETQSFDFREEDWNEVSKQLHNSSFWNSVYTWRLVSLFLLLLLGAAVFCFSKKINNTKNQISILQKDFANFKNTKATTTNVNDTVFKHVVVTQYDTLYKTIIETTYKNEYKKSSPISDLNRNNTLLSIDKQINQTKQLQNYRNEKGFVNTQENKIIKGINTHAKELNNEYLLNGKHADDLSRYQYNKTFVKFLEAQEITPQQFSKRVFVVPPPEYLSLVEPQKKKRFIPNQFYLGILGSWNRPKIYSKNSLASPFNKIKRSAYQLGIKGEWTFLRNLSLQGSVAYEELKYQSGALDSIWGIDDDFIENDSIISSSYNGEITAMQIKKTSLKYTLGLKYYWLKHNKFRSYIGANIETQSNVQQSVDLIFTETGYPSFVIELNDTLEEKAFQLNNISPNIGLNYRLLENWYWQLEMTYQFELNKKPKQMFAPFGVQTAILYLF